MRSTKTDSDFNFQIMRNMVMNVIFMQDMIGEINTNITCVYQSINYIMCGFLTLLFKNPISFHKSEFPLSPLFNVLHTIKHRILIIRTYFLCG